MIRDAPMGLSEADAFGSGMDRADVDVDDLLKVILGLVFVWLLVEILGAVLDIAGALFDLVPNLLAVAIVVLIAVRLADRF